MYLHRKFLVAPLATLALLLTAMPSTAQTLTVTISGETKFCEFSEDEGPIEASFTVSGGSGVVEVDLGGNIGSIPVPAASFDELISAVSDAGGTISINFNESLGGPSFCTFIGTITFSLDGGGIGPNAPGNLATTTAVIDTFVRSALPAISNRIRALFRGTGTGVLASANGVTVSGMAAGNGDGLPLGVWAGYSYTDSKNDFITTAFTSRRHNVLLGLDTMPAENWVVGVSVALEKTDVNTRFNGGEQDITGVSFTPYMGYLLSDWLSLDAAVGVSTVSTDQFRTTNGARITSDLDSTRIFGSMNATGTWTFDRLLASARAGFLYATQDDDDFMESNGTSFGSARSTVGRFLLGGELAYSSGAWEPYVGATYEYDFTRTRLTFAPGVAQPRSDDSDVLVAVGVRYFGSDDLSGAIEYSRLLGRRNLDEDTFSANVRWQY